MATDVNLWDAQVWSFFVILAILFTALLLANLLRRLIKPLAKTLLPSSVLAGFLLLVADWIFRLCTGDSMFTAVTLEALTYHGLGLGVVAMTLRSSDKVKGKERRRDVFNTGISTVSSYLLQAVIGLAITVGLSYAIDCWSGSGILLPMGYGQGPGQAFNWGNTYQGMGFENGATFGLSVAAMGFVSASIGGVFYLGRMRAKGRFKGISGSEASEDITAEMVSTKDDVPLSESLDKLTIQFGLVFFTYFVTYGIMYGLSYLFDASGVGLLINTVKPLVWGFNFLFAMLVAMAVKGILGALKAKGVIKRNYLNNFLLTRVSGFMFDLMVVAAIAVINLTAFKHREFILPLALICVAGCVATYLWMQFVCRKLFPAYSDEQFLTMFGMLTGTVSTGLILLREIDPQYKTPAADNLIYQNLWAIVFGFPMLLLMGFIDGTRTSSFLVLGACAALLIAMVLVLFRNQIFRKKNDKKAE